jgi:SAM-dependent methyltransferase
MLGRSLMEIAGEQQLLLQGLGVRSTSDAAAVDLGCGPGYQSIALSELGYRVLALDCSDTLIGILRAATSSRTITSLVGDIQELGSFVSAESAEVVVCMGDTLTHLPTRKDVRGLFKAVAIALKASGLFVLSFRDLAAGQLHGLDRFIPVRSDDDRIMTCFLEYESADAVIVHDLIYARTVGGQWSLKKSCYRKLRLAAPWVCDELSAAGFRITTCRQGRMTEIAAQRSREP